MVDMSRQTGRRNHTVESSDWGSIDVMKSIGYVRGSISKNIILSTKRKEKPGKNRLFNASNYDYDYRIVKPKRNGLMDFGRLRGRV